MERAQARCGVGRGSLVVRPATTPGIDELSNIVASGNTTNYGYTSDGQTSSQGTTRFSWDGYGRIRTATVGSNTVSYAYDPTGALKVRASSSPSSTINYLLGDLLETNASGTITTSYADGPAGNLASYAGAPITSSTATYLYYDAHGNLAAEANSSGTITGNHTYDPFGAPTDTPPTNTTVHRFTGRWNKQYDTTTGDILMGARPYDPTTGRFLSVDPIPGGSLNNYDYAGQDPINNYDLDGTCVGRSCDGEDDGDFSLRVRSARARLRAIAGSALNGILRFGRQLEGADYRTVQGILTRLARQAGWDVNEDLRTYQDGARAIKIWSGNRVIIIERAGAGGPRKGIPAGSWYAKISPGDQGLYGNTPYRIKLGP